MNTLETKVTELIDASKYDEAVELIRKELDITMKCEFIKNGLHFADDTETRDIYKITLSHGSRSYSFNYGQSIIKSQYYQDSIKGRTYTLNGGARTGNYVINDIQKYKSSQSLKLVKGDEPTLYDVIACIQKYDVGSFADFCSEFGYDEDSRKAEKIYNAVCDEYMNVSRLFNDSEIEILSLIS